MIKKYAKQILYSINKNPISRKIFNSQIEIRSRLELTDIYKLSKPISMFAPFTNEIHPPNDWYGHATNIKKFLNLSLDYQFKFILEHGLYLDNQIDQVDSETNLPVVITYSNYRENAFKKTGKQSFAIGPFINYASSLLSKKQIDKEKKRLGKSVLFFPAHSTPVIGMNFDTSSLVKQIKKISKNYQSVRICLYWKDILMGRDRPYKDAGFECVTAGHMLDPNFLPRLKSLIEISDLTAANIISSQTGFCIFLKKPHIYIDSNISLKTDRHWKKKINDVFESDEYLQIVKEFSKLNYKVSPKQKMLIKKYWGTDTIKSKRQLEDIVTQSENIYRKH